MPTLLCYCRTIRNIQDKDHLTCCQGDSMCLLSGVLIIRKEENPVIVVNVDRTGRLYSFST